MESGFRELLEEFLLEARERAGEVEAQLLRLGRDDPTGQAAALARIKSELHTLKGNSGMMGFSELQAIAHGMEDQVAALSGDPGEVDALLERLDALRGGLDQVDLDGDPFDEPAASADEAVGGAARGQASDAGSISIGAKDDEAVADRESEDPSAVDLAGGGRRERGSSVRVPFSKIDHLVEVLAETLIYRNRLSDTVEALRREIALLGDLSPASERRLRDAAADVEAGRQSLDKTLDELQGEVTGLGMVPLQGLFRSLGRVVHDASRNEGKQVDLAIEGGETPIDRTLLEVAGDALGHLVRNAVVHGIETPEIRRLRGKRERGTVRLSAEIEAGEVRIEVADDGGGIDRERLRQKARASLGAESDQLAIETLIFEDGLTTRDATDLAAGRGVGLSAVQRAVERQGGRVQVASQEAVGSSFRLHLPVAAAIQRSLLVTVDDETYALPLQAIAESMRLDDDALHEIDRAEVVRWRGLLVPLIDLGMLFGTRAHRPAEGFVVVIEVNGRTRGLVIDGLSGIRDIVVKSLDSIVGQPPGIFGSTILGDGRVIMILDPAALVTHAPSRVEPTRSDRPHPPARSTSPLDPPPGA
ncbi:MAG: chemotaxis protein CheW [Acidobacteriota bacterium]